MTYRIGDKISHPGHGACIVKDICERDFAQVKAMYYVLSSMVEDKTAIYVPINKAEKLGLRDLITEDEADVLLDSLDRAENVWIADRTKRHKQFETLFVINNKAALLESMSALSSIVCHRVEKPLGTHEKNMLHAIQNKTLSEIALAKGITLADAIARAEHLILQRLPKEAM